MTRHQVLPHPSSRSDHGDPEAVLRWWPSLAGAALAVFIALDMRSGSELAPVLAASGLVYVGAAALRKRSTAWPLFFGTFAIITVAKLGIMIVDPTWVFLGLAFLFVVYGMLRGGLRPMSAVPLQAAAMAGFGTAAAVALIVSGDAGAYLVAGGLLAHAAWDVYHHWTNKVVVRSMAEFCCVLDTLLSVVILTVAVSG
jgi:hypothetical protein